MRRRSVFGIAIFAGLILVLVTPREALAQPHQDSEQWVWPLAGGARGGESVGPGRIESGFHPPESDYGPGHRGIDIAAQRDTDVLAVAAGRVSFVGTIDGVPNVVVKHGKQRSTYQPVRAGVHVGQRVKAGTVLGTLSGRGSHCAHTCLHLGRISGARYLDPAELLGNSGDFVLISPDGAAPKPPDDAVRSGSLNWPVDGPVTSPFGTRVHPITGVKKLHDGTDIGADCGTPVSAVAPGRVIQRSSDTAYGNRVLVDHGGKKVTAYNHLSRQNVHKGDHVKEGDTVGLVGQTGMATGCHLHFMVLSNGNPVDPVHWLEDQ